MENPKTSKKRSFNKKKQKDMNTQENGEKKIRKELLKDQLKILLLTNILADFLKNEKMKKNIYRDKLLDIKNTYWNNKERKKTSSHKLNATDNWHQLFLKNRFTLIFHKRNSRPTKPMFFKLMTSGACSYQTC